MDWDETDDAAFVELVNNQSDDELSMQDAERQTMTGAGGFFVLVLVLVIVVMVAASALS